LSEQVALLVHKDEEEGLVLEDGAADPSSKLVPVLIVFLDAVKVVEPVAGVERRIPVVLR